MNLKFAEAPAREELSTHVCDMAYDSPSRKRIAFSVASEVASKDLVVTPEPVIFNSAVTIVLENRCVLCVWNDIESGCSAQVARVMRHMVGMHMPALAA